MTIRTFPSILVSTLLFGCGLETESGGPEPSQPENAEREIPLADASVAMPCGKGTVGDVQLVNGHRLTVCVHADGVETFHEVGPIGAEVAVDSLPRPRCGADVWLALTGDDVAIPQALLDACPPETALDLRERAISQDAVLAPEAALVAQHKMLGRANYCGATGASSFGASCYQCAPYDDCIDWCVTSFWGWHDRTMSGGSFLGEEGNIAMEKNAACSGKVRVRQYSRDDVGDAWETQSDYWLNAGTSATSGMIYHSAAIFGQDYDFRLRADSDGVGVHRHTGYFLDE